MPLGLGNRVSASRNFARKCGPKLELGTEKKKPRRRKRKERLEAKRLFGFCRNPW